MTSEGLGTISRTPVLSRNTHRSGAPLLTIAVVAQRRCVNMDLRPQVLNLVLSWEWFKMMDPIEHPDAYSMAKTEVDEGIRNLSHAALLGLEPADG